MRGFRLAVLAAMVTMFVCSGLRAQSRIPWTEDLTVARQVAQQQQRLLLLHFWSNSCPPCLRLERYVFNQPEVIRAVGSNYVPVKINATDNPQLAAQFRVDRWPTDIIATVDGQEIYRGVSEQDPNRYIAILDQVAANTRVGFPIEGSASTPIAQTPTPNSGPLGAAYPAPNQAAMAPAPQQPAPQANIPMGQRPRSAPAESIVNRYAAAPAMDMPQRPAAIAPAYGSQFVPPNSNQPNYANNGAMAQQAALGGQQQMPQNQSQMQPPMQPQIQQPTWPPSGATGAQINPSHGAAAVAGGSQAPAGNSVATTNPAQSGMPAQRGNSAQRGESPRSNPTQMPIGLEGYCPVTLVEQQKWVKGDPQWGAIHEGRTYLFVGAEEQRKFLAGFDKYAPILSGYDPVQFVDRGTLVEGKRAHGVFYRDQIYLFADEASLQQFWSAPERFSLAVLTARRQQRGRDSTQR